MFEAVQLDTAVTVWVCLCFPLLIHFQTNGAAKSGFLLLWTPPPQLQHAEPRSHSFTVFFTHFHGTFMSLTAHCCYLCRSLVCVWRSCGPPPPLPPSAPPGSPGYSGRQPPAPVPLRHRRTGCGAAAEAAEGEARTRRPEKPGRAAVARWGP